MFVEYASSDSVNTSYQLDPCPEQVRLNVTTFLSCALILSSPLYAYYFDGREGGWAQALWPTWVGILWIAYEDWRFERKVPSKIRYQKYLGKVYPPLTAPDKPSSLMFTTKRANEGSVLLNGEGVYISARALLRSSKGIARRKTAAIGSGDEANAQKYMMKIDWKDIVEWAVRGGSTSQSYYYLRHRKGQFVELRRPLAAGQEQAVLTHVRTVGQCLVRIYDDAK